MEILSFKNCEAVKIEQFSFKGQMHPVTGTSVRWLSKDGDDGNGNPEYGLRYFTIQPGGEIPIHNHFYVQTMYILRRQFECWQFDLESEELVGNKVAGPGDFIYVPSMEPHGMRNINEGPSSFLCCIANVYEKNEE